VRLGDDFWEELMTLIAEIKLPEDVSLTVDIDPVNLF